MKNTELTMKKAVHVYQRSADWGVIFYTIQDLLVYFTIFCVFARRYGVQVLGLALMYNHLHQLLSASSRKDIEAFVAVISALFARYFNIDVEREGAVFHKAFGSAVVYGDKNIRTIAGYLYNNHTNKKLCDKAEEVRWNFLAYAHNDHPFSEPIILNKASKRLRKALKMVDSFRAREQYLGYGAINTIFSKLNPTEKEQIIDYIISKYNCIDYEALEGLYRSFDEMIYSFNANTFNEYEIKEGREEKYGDDRVYKSLAFTIMTTGKYKRLKDILVLPDDEKNKLAIELQAATGIPISKIAAYLHLEIRSGA